MKIYIDVIFFVNFSYDFLILLTTSIILKRKTSIKRLILSSLVGSLSIFILFINIDSFNLFLLKILLSTIMVLIAFKSKLFIKNISYFYFTSIILGGFIYFLNNQFSYKVEGLVFINNGFSINFILLLVLAPIILYFYIKQNHYTNNNISNIYNITIKYENKTYNYKGYLDTGNKLKDPYSNKKVSILYDKNLKINKYFYIPYNTLNNNGLLKAIKVDMIIDNKYIFNKQILAITDEQFNLENTDIILNSEFKNYLN